MLLFTALSTFSRMPLDRSVECRVCGRDHEQGTVVFWKTYRGRFKQACRVILCDEECHSNYDLAYWEGKTATKDSEEHWNRQERIQKQAEAEGYGYSAPIVRDALSAKLSDLEWSERREEMKNFEV